MAIYSICDLYYIGSLEDLDLDTLEDKVFICCQDWVPHQWLLPYCDAIIHHGGLGTTTTALG